MKVRPGHGRTCMTASSVHGTTRGWCGSTGTVQCSTVQYSAVQYCAVHRTTMQHRPAVSRCICLARPIYPGRPGIFIPTLLGTPTWRHHGLWHSMAISKMLLQTPLKHSHFCHVNVTARKYCFQDLYNKTTKHHHRQSLKIIWFQVIISCPLTAF